MTEKRVGFLVCAIMLAGLGASAAYARDAVTLRDGRRLSNVTVIRDNYDGVAIDTNNDGEADETFDAREVAQIEYSDAPGAYRQALLSIRGGRLERAVEELKRALEEKERVFWLAQYGNFHLGETLSRLGEGNPEMLAEAREAYQEVVAQAPRHRLVPDAIRGIGLSYLEAGQHDRAEREFTRLVEENRYGEEWRVRGKLLLARVKGEKGAYQEGLALCEEATDDAERAGLDDVETLIVRTRAGVLLAAGEYQKAHDAFLEMARNAGDRDEETKAIAYNAIGDALFGMGRTREALLAYLRVRVLYFRATDELPRALYGAARCFTVLREADKARELVNILRNDYPNSAWTAKAVEELEG